MTDHHHLADPPSAQPHLVPSRNSAPTASDAELTLDVAALLLDMDGTLIDSGPAVLRCWNRLFVELGAKDADGQPLTYRPALHGMPARTVLRHAIPSLTDDEVEDAFARIETLETEDLDGVTVLPGTVELLDRLTALGEEIGKEVWTIVTSCTTPLFQARWGATGLPVPAHTVTVDQVLVGKPEPDPYLEGARRLGVDPADCLVLEDAVGGLLSARAAGAQAIAVSHTSQVHDLRRLARTVVSSLADLTVNRCGDMLRVTAPLDSPTD
ncbi:HAD-IA family hydrolase [Devriesea agamarum]|uniref:HAD-IA family hydrolase n=1 Tax=Devriesea agamarum TaxID=472569 RepID=UPI00071C8C79|nr:HAD-IA family hydrolase [Devriesea agamarum]